LPLQYLHYATQVVYVVNCLPKSNMLIGKAFMHRSFKTVNQSFHTVGKMSYE